MAALEGGIGALATASGSAAISLAVLNITKCGQNIVSSQTLYGGTVNLFKHTLRDFGIEARFVDASDPANIEKAIDEKTRLVFLESIGNPANDVVDFDAISAIAHKHGIPVIVDNTVTSPLLFRPFDHGVDVVVHSATKVLGGRRNRGARGGGRGRHRRDRVAPRARTALRRTRQPRARARGRPGPGPVVSAS